MTYYNGEFVKLGSSGVKVSRVAFGCGFRDLPDEKDAEKAIRQAMDCGINFFDCANLYKVANDVKSETVLGRAMKGRRDEFVITTKVCGHNSPAQKANEYGASRHHIMKEIDNSLSRLQTDHIDIYLLHQPDEEGIPYEETYRALDTLCTQGKIRYVGACNHAAWEIVKALSTQHNINAQPLVTIQNSYNLLNRSLEDEIFPMCNDYGVGIMAYSPLAAGLMGGLYRKNAPLSKESFWGKSPLYTKYYNHIFNSKIGDIVETVYDISVKYNVSMAQIASAWVLTHKEITCILPGPNSFEEFEDSLRAASLKLEAEDVKILDDISDGMRAKFDAPTVVKIMEREENKQ